MSTFHVPAHRHGFSLWSLLFIGMAFIGSSRSEAPDGRPRLPKVGEGCAVPGPALSPDAAPGGVDFAVTVVAKDATHPQFGMGFPSGFAINGTQGLELFLVRGTTYVFSISGGHPFAFSSSVVGGPANIGLNYPAGSGISGSPAYPATSGTVTFTPNAGYPDLLYYVCNAHNNMGWKINLSDPPVLLNVKVMLEGPYDGATLMMRDSLRSSGVLPVSEPYTVLGYAHVGSGGETTSAPVLATTGPDAPVDWMMLELRSAADPAAIVASYACLVQRDGDLMRPDGTVPLVLNQPPDDYYIAVRHRNHLGAMTASAIPLGTVPATTIDLTLPATPTYGTNAQKALGGTGVMGLWAGDVNFDGQVKYTGGANDRDLVLLAIGGTVPTGVVNGQYRREDVNMNVQVKYTGSLNDRDLILVNIGGTVPTAVRDAQLP